MRRIDNLVEGEVIVGQEAYVVKEEVSVEEENICVEIVKEKPKEENTETEATEKESVEDIVNASEFVTPPTQEVADDAGAKLKPEE
ncbi:hypothetical protein PVK06_027066 [Gossypium arboreum]|uniref:Uncharacterized protein n=1 Tax=Gossypium arboreum TaxID=29729 RepID=A0ABR0P0K8_GOSAR|nr:hypothetical protein PVK06_027066 [Gossypium arboreum]